MQQKKLDPILIKKLQSIKETENSTVLSELRSKGKPEYIPYVISLFKETGHDTIQKESFKLLSELKQEECVPYIIEAMLDEDNSSIKKELVEVCWQNGLKYTQFLPIFIDFVIHENDAIAFEAFTVIENMEYLPGENILNQEIVKIEEHIMQVSENKKYFLNEVLRILKENL